MQQTTEQEIILSADDRAATYKTITGWVSRNGKFYGEVEQWARMDGSTHKQCDTDGCGKIFEKTSAYTICSTCLEKSNAEKYLALNFKEYDYSTPVYSHAYDKYFFDDGQIEEFIYEQLDEDDVPEANQPEAAVRFAAELELVYCLPNHARKLDSDLWADELPEDVDELPKQLTEKMKEFNEFLKTLEPLSWSPGKIRTEFKFDGQP